jgi:paraquat-inducible protein B
VSGETEVEETNGEAHVRRTWFSWFWIAPLFAAVIVAWLGWRTLAERGPAITIMFKTAEGLLEGQSKIRHKGIDVGTVESLELTGDLSQVVVHARMTRSVAPHLTDGTRFWVVEPRVGATGVSGLNTLVSGAYIEMAPAAGPPERHFVGLDAPPVLQPDTPGRSFTLIATDLGALEAGSTIYYRGISVGEIEGYALKPSGNELEVYAFVRSPYQRLIHPDTHFWAASGVNISAGAEGVQLRINSWEELLSGGIGFDTPEASLSGAPSSAGAVFKLYESRGAAGRVPRGPQLIYRVDFAGSVRGLEYGTPVELQGIGIGQVTEIHLLYDDHTQSLFLAASLALDPEVLEIVDAKGATPAEHASAVAERIERLVTQGLRAQLLTASFLTGQKIVALEMTPGAPSARVQRVGDAMLLPSAPAADVDEILKGLQRTVQHIDRATAGPELGHALKSLDESLTHLQHITADLEPQVQPLVASLRAAADAAQRTLQSAGATLGNGAGANLDVPRLMQQLGDAARAVRELADYLDRHPEALIRGRRSGSE